MTEILDKTREWSDRYGHILKASAQTQFPWLYKGAVGGIEHVISVDNGAYHMELWRSGENEGNYYATTGAAIKPLPGLAKGARLDEALDRFFHLMAKVTKDKAAMKRRLNMHDTPQSPHREHMGGGDAVAQAEALIVAIRAGKKKLQVLLAEADKPPEEAFQEGWRENKAIPEKIKRLLGLKKRIMEKVDPEIGPSQSVGQRKPSDLSPESGVSKLAKRMIVDLVGEPTAQMRKNGQGADWYASSKLNPGRRKPVKKNVVALTGNQPGSGRVKPATPKPPAATKPGTPAQTYRSPQGFSGQRMGGGKGAPGTSGGRLARARKAVGGLGQKTTHRRAPYVAGRPGGKVDALEGGRVGAGGKITPVKPATGGPGQPSGYGSTGKPTYDYSRYQKGCRCGAVAEVARAMKAIRTR
jgi:hypothetical protein